MTKVQLADATFDSPWQCVSGEYKCMGSGPLAGRKDLAGRSSPKTFHRKVRIKKSTIETNYGLKTCFIKFFFRERFFSDVNLSIQNTTR